MGSNQLDTQLEATQGLESAEWKMEMSVVQKSAKVNFSFSNLLTQRDYSQVDDTEREQTPKGSRKMNKIEIIYSQRNDSGFHAPIIYVY